MLKRTAADNHDILNRNITDLRIGCYNVKGLKAREEEIYKILDREKLHVFAFVETMIQRRNALHMRWRSVRLLNEPRSEGARAAGDVTILVKNSLLFKAGLKRVFRRTEIVTINIAGTMIGAIYSPPRAPVTGLLAVLDAFNETARGSAVLLGDFNARHLTWCSRNTARGNKPRQWAQMKWWRIHAHNGPTFQDQQGRQSTIDLVLTKSGQARGLRIVNDWRQPFSGSDRDPIMVQWRAHAPQLQPNANGIPKKKRKDERAVNFAEEWLTKELPWHISELGRNATQHQLDSAYKSALSCFLQPWYRLRSRPRPERWSYFWSVELQRLSQLRSRLWRKWKRTRLPQPRSEGD